MEVATSADQRNLISSFVEIAVGQTMESAKHFLDATSWNLEEAINLFLIHRNNQALPDQNSSEQYFCDYEEEHIPPPLPSKRGTLYDSYSMHQPSTEVCPNKIWDSESPGSDSRLSSIYRPPQDLLFKGSFEEAKSSSSRKNLWLLVNLQSMTEFASHTLNRDVWSNDAASQAIVGSFILWQVYDDSNEGQKISTFYKIVSVPPVVLLIDPITGQKMRSWTGVIEAQTFFEDLLKFTDEGPHEHIASLKSNKRIKTEPITCFPSNASTLSTFWGDEFEDSAEGNSLISSEEEETCSSINYADQVLATSPGNKSKETTTLAEPAEDGCTKFPNLTEEPKGDCDKSVVCSICIRFPDGRREQRRFLKSEPIQLLWSFCHSHMEESDGEKVFKLVHAVPGASNTLEYSANMTFQQSGITNSMISVTWE